MFVLAIDTSTPAVTAGVAERTGEEVSVLAQRVTVDPKAHTELLTPYLREVLAEAGVTPEAIVVGAGPGPFTGLRVGMVTAAAFGHALGLPVHPVCSLDAMAREAAAAPEQHQDGADPVLVATDARRREIYWGLYRAGVRVRGPEVTKPAEVAELLAEHGVRRAVGAGAELYAAQLTTPTAGPRYPGVAGLVSVADLASAPAPLAPLYLRRPDAEVPAVRKRVSRR